MEKTKGQKSNLIKAAVLVGTLLIGIMGAASGPFLDRAAAQEPDSNTETFIGPQPVDEPVGANVDDGYPSTVVVTEIVTMTSPVTVSIPVIVETTLTKTSDYPQIFDRPAPVIPHIYRQNLQHSGDALYDDGEVICWLCHGVPPQEHDFWVRDAEICARCHKVSENPVKMVVY